MASIATPALISNRNLILNKALLSRNKNTFIGDPQKVVSVLVETKRESNSDPITYTYTYQITDLPSTCEYYLDNKSGYANSIIYNTYNKSIYYIKQEFNNIYFYYKDENDIYHELNYETFYPTDIQCYLSNNHLDVETGNISHLKYPIVYSEKFSFNVPAETFYTDPSVYYLDENSVVIKS